MKLKGKIANDGLKSISARRYTAEHHEIPRIWAVIADHHRVRIFTKPDGHLELIGEAAPAHHGRRKGMPDKAMGRVASSSRTGVRHKLQPHGGPHEKEDFSFVTDVAEWLDHAAKEDAFDRIILIAPPRMLGELRDSLSQQVQTRIAAEINKDLTKMNEKSLQKELEEILWL